MQQTPFWSLIFILFDVKFSSTQKSRTTPNPLSTTARTNYDVNQKTLDTLQGIRTLIRQYGEGFHRGHSLQLDGKEYHLGLYGYRQNKEHQTCQIEQKDYPPWNMTFDTGEIVNEIWFDCGASEKCCELDCCPTIAWWIIFLAVVAAVGILVLCCCICIRCKKTEKEITEQVKEESDELLRTGHFGGSAQKLPKV